MNRMLLTTAFALLAGGSATATGFTWVPVSGTNDWSAEANWTPAGGPPGANVADTVAVLGSAAGVINYNSEVRSSPI